MNLLEFIDCSTCNFWAVATVAEQLETAGFTKLNLTEKWNLLPGGKYYFTKNESAIFAFRVGNGGAEVGFRIISAHSDSPGFRIKPNPEIITDGNVLKLNTEVYGGPILYTWFDRPLSISGRVVVRTDNPLHPATKLVRFNRPLLTIPHLAIHFNRAVNEGNPLSKQADMLPVLGHIDDSLTARGTVLRLVADEIGVAPGDILDMDLTLYDTTPACTFGLNNEYISAGRIDDLSMVYCAMQALLSTGTASQTQVMAIFDNEETGSGTKQGAASPVLANALQRIVASVGGDNESYLRAVAESFMISADNAHGFHPNYASKYDPTNHPVLGGGPVIKVNANCKYMTDAESSAVFMEICRRAGVPYQQFVNHSDVAGGSTLGNILTSQIDLRGVDMGAPVWAMHSVRETASVVDHEATEKAFTAFYSL